MFVSFYALLLGAGGYLSTCVLEPRRAVLSTIILFGFGIGGLLFFWHLLLWGTVNLGGLILLHLVSILAQILVLKRMGKSFRLPLRLCAGDFLGLAILCAWVLEQWYGDWDSWAVWNVKARHMAFGGRAWMTIFSCQGWTPAAYPFDYPLLLPSLIASFWSFSFCGCFLVPLAVGLLFSWAVFLLLNENLSELLGPRLGLAASLIVLLTPAFLSWSVRQYADLPLAAYLLLAVTVLIRAQTPLQFAAGGFALGLAMFLKNEATLYLVILAASAAWAGWRHGLRFRRANLLCLLAGIMPGFLSWAAIKAVAPAHFFVSDSPAQFFSRITLSRLMQVAAECAGVMLDWNEWVLFWPVCIALFFVLKPAAGRRSFWDSCLSSFLLASFCSYFLVYMATPFDIAWHIRFSFGRLLLQIVPIFILVLAMRLKPMLKGCPGPES